MRTVRGALIAADLLAVMFCLWLAAEIADMVAQGAHPTGPGDYLKAAEYVAGLPLLAVLVAIGGARALARRGHGRAAAAVLAMPLAVTVAWLRWAMR